MLFISFSTTILLKTGYDLASLNTLQDSETEGTAPCSVNSPLNLKWRHNHKMISKSTLNGRLDQFILEIRYFGKFNLNYIDE